MTEQTAANGYVDPDDLLMGGGVEGAKFPVIGTTYKGIVKAKRAEQRRDYDDNSILLYWKDGNPKMQIVAELQCEATGFTFNKTGDKVELPDDDGMRAAYIKGQMTAAVRDAIRKAGGKGLDIGGELTLTYVANGKQDNPKYNPPKLFAAIWRTPAQVAADNAVMGTGAPEGDDPFAV